MFWTDMVRSPQATDRNRLRPAPPRAAGVPRRRRGASWVGPARARADSRAGPDAQAQPRRRGSEQREYDISNGPAVATAGASPPTARARTGSPAAPASMPGSTTRTGGRGCVPGGCARTTPAPAGSSSPAENMAGRRSPRADPECSSEGFSPPRGFHCTPGTIGSSAQLSASSATCSHACDLRRADAG